MAQTEFCIFGRKPVIEAFSTGKRFDKILVLKGAMGEDIKNIQALVKQHDTPVQYVPKEKIESVLRKYFPGKELNHQGIVGFLSIIDYYSIDDVLNHAYSKAQSPLLVVLDGVTDVGNFGAIARSAECFGAHALVVPATGSAQINAEAIKASAGSLNRILVCREKSIVMAVKLLKANGIKVYGTDMKNAVPPAKADLKEPVALIMGAEGSGLTPDVAKLCDGMIAIPMSGETESLNVSVAAGIILYEAMNQRM